MPLLQSPMQNGSWSGKKIASARFVASVKALLATGGSGMGDLMTGHSAKATGFSWLDKGHVSCDDSAILGHHVVKGDRTMLAYSRDHEANPLRTLERVYQKGPLPPRLHQVRLLAWGCALHAVTCAAAFA